MIEQMLEITEHDRRYWQYEYDVVQLYLLPLLRDWGVRISGTRLLDIGCGDGGGVSALADAGMICQGFDIEERRVRLANAMKGSRAYEMIVGDIYANQPPFAGEHFDLVVMHDVFEHLEQKAEVLRRIAAYLAPGGKVLITFPPYYSAFGAHQQVLRSPIARLPFSHYIPFFSSFILPRLHGEHQSFIEEIQKLAQMRMGLRKFEHIIASSDLKIAHDKFYLISPNHLRFGLRPTGAGIFGLLPGIREIITSGAVYLLRKMEGVQTQ